MACTIILSDKLWKFGKEVHFYVGKQNVTPPLPPVKILLLKYLLVQYDSVFFALRKPLLTILCLFVISQKC